MTDMSNLTVEEKREYLRILQQMALGNSPTTEELLALPMICKEALVDVLRDKLYQKPPSRWKRLIASLKK